MTAGIADGSLDYNTAIKNVVYEMTKYGVRTIDYKSGRTYRIESAVRTVLMTGVNQITSKISDENGEKLDTPYFEVSAHGTARPSHQVWQGKVYTKQELEDVCGLGEVDGLCGANCRHHYWPFIYGVSVRAYTDEELKEMAERDNEPREWKGRKYTAYEATQVQRKMELRMRKQREDIKLLKEAGVDNEELILAQARYRIQMDEYVRFSKAMGIPQQLERINSDNLKYNFRGGAEVDETESIERLKDDLYDLGVKGKIKIPPEPIDTSNLSFNDKHTNKERQHGVTEEEAKQFIKEAKLSTEKWNGRFVNYYGSKGSAYVDRELNEIKTAYSSKQFDDVIKNIGRKMKEYGRWE